MSMLIEGVDMPRGTNMMLLISPDGDVWEMGDLLGNDKLIDGAKAVPVPTPHGRCIDADAARRSIKPWSPEDERSGCTFDTVKKLMHTMLDRAPTIIPEEGEK